MYFRWSGALLMLFACRGVEPAVFAAAPPQLRHDPYGDVLPACALARIGTSRLRHGGEVVALAFAPDGKTLASVGEDQTMALWESRTGKEVWRNGPQRGFCSALAWSADGKQLLAIEAGFDGIRRWDARSGAPHKSTRMPGGLVTNLFQNGQVLFAEDKGIRVRDAVTGKELGLHIPAEGVPSLSADGKRLAVGSSGAREGSVYEVRTGKRLCAFGRRGGSTALALSPDGKRLAEARAGSRFVRFFDASTGKELRPFKGYQEAPAVLVFSWDGRQLAAGGMDGTVSVWEVEAGELHCTFPAADNAVRCLSFSPDGKALASGGGRHIRLWDVPTGKPAPAMGSRGGPVHHVAFSLCGTLIATAGGTGPVPELALWDAATGKLRQRVGGFRGAVLGLAFGAHRKELVVVQDKVAFPDEADQAIVRSYDLRSGKETRRFLVALSPLLVPKGRQRVAFSPGGKYLAFTPHAGGMNAFVETWEVAAGKKLRSTVVAANDPTFAISADGNLLLLFRTEKEELYALPPGKARRVRLRLGDGFDGSHVPACSPDGTSLATASAGGAHLWDLKTGKPRHLSTESAGCLVFSPDGKLVIAGYATGSVRVWDVGSGKLRHELKGHRGAITAVAFSPDGKRLASASTDTTVLIWDVSRPK